MPNIQKDRSSISGDMSKSLSLSEKILATVLMLTVAMSVVAPSIEWSNNDYGTIGSLVRRIWYPALATVTFFCVKGGLYSKIKPFPGPIAVGLLWFWASLAWTNSLNNSLVRLVLTTLTIWIIFSTVRRLRGDLSIMIVRYVLGIALVVNFVAVFAFPQIGVLRGEVGNWQGIMTEKNQAGALCALTCLFWTLNVPHKLKVYGIVIAVFSAIFLVMTWSRTAMIMLVVSYIIYGLMQGGSVKALIHDSTPRGIRNIALWMTGTMFVLIFYYTFVSDKLLLIAQDPELFSKRGMIWRPMIQAYLDNPIAGTGFGGFWELGNTKKQEFGGSWLYRVSQGHNGYLDLALQTGAIGLLLSLVAILVWPVTETLRQFPSRPKRSAFVLALAVFCIGSNVTESGLFERDRIWHIFLMFALAVLYAGKHRRAKAVNIEKGERRGRLPT